MKNKAKSFWEAWRQKKCDHPDIPRKPSFTTEMMMMNEEDNTDPHKKVDRYKNY